MSPPSGSTRGLNRLRYDTCAYSKALAQSTAPIDYILNPIKYENCGKCRMELGLVGGPGVSHINGNLVDLENDLMNIRRPSTRCPEFLWQPQKKSDGPRIRTKTDDHPGRAKNPDIATESLNLRPCQMVSYPEVPLPAPTKPFTCR